MSGNLLILIELALVLIVVFGWGFYELWALRKFKRCGYEIRRIKR